MKRLIRKIFFPYTYNSDVYIKTLQKKYNIDIGSQCYFWSPNRVTIDTQRPTMLHIGNYVKFTSGVTVLCHDYSRSVIMNMPGLSNVGEAKMTWIGDNVFLGINSIILMGAHIGNNSIVGAGSVVSGYFEDGLVIAGNPARKICTIEEFFQKKKTNELEAAKLFVLEWVKKYNSLPTINDMSNSFSWIYTPHTLSYFESNFELFSYRGINYDIVKENFINSKPLFSSYDEFIQYCLKDCNKELKIER